MIRRVDLKNYFLFYCVLTYNFLTSWILDYLLHSLSLTTYFLSSSILIIYFLSSLSWQLSYRILTPYFLSSRCWKLTSCILLTYLPYLLIFRTLFLNIDNYTSCILTTYFLYIDNFLHIDILFPEYWKLTSCPPVSWQSLVEVFPRVPV